MERSSPKTTRPARGTTSSDVVGFTSPRLAPVPPAATSRRQGRGRKRKSSSFGPRGQDTDTGASATPQAVFSAVAALAASQRAIRSVRGHPRASKRARAVAGTGRGTSAHADASDETETGRGAGSGAGRGGQAGTITEVAERSAGEVLESLEHIVADAVASILDLRGFAFTVPNRGAGNQLYLADQDRLVLGSKVSARPFVSTASVRKTTVTSRVMELVHQVLLKGIHVTKRDLFYTDVKLFKDQHQSDSVLDDIACMAGCTRTSLHVVASEKGIVVGRVTFRDDGDLIDCSRMGVGGKAIPPFIDRVTDIRSDAQFILLVEKDAAFMRLAEDRFYNTYRCIIITAKGQPDVATRLFLKRLKTVLGLPVLGLVDSDPYGLKILSVYMSGSKNMSYDSASLTTPDIKWLGVRPSDLDRYSIPEQCRLDMTESDLKTGRELLQEDFIRKNPEWTKELELMIKSKKKAEIRASRRP